jgi:hypothetical protein
MNFKDRQKILNKLNYFRNNIFNLTKDQMIEFTKLYSLKLQLIPIEAIFSIDEEKNIRDTLLNKPYLIKNTDFKKYNLENILNLDFYIDLLHRKSKNIQYCDIKKYPELYDYFKFLTL